jgi:hypothetical protein
MSTLKSRHSHLRSAALQAALAITGLATTPAAWAAWPAHQTAPAAGDTYLNGGIGHDSQEIMRQEAHKWPLRMTFSEGTEGAFVAEVALKIQDHAGHTVLEVRDAGPMTYVRVPRGNYRITATYKGKTLTRNVSIGAQGSNVYFRW